MNLEIKKKDKKNRNKKWTELEMKIQNLNNVKFIF